MREALRGQLPLTEDDIVLTLSAIKNGQARVYAPGHTKAGKPSIIQSVPINGYTLYTEEISKKSKDGVSDLIGHTIWKAPTLPTAAGSGTSPVPLPRRQSAMLSKYSISQNGKKSTVQFVAGKDGKAAQLYYEDNNGAFNKDHLLGGLILLSGDSTVIDNASDGGTTVQGYALMQKPFVITEGHKVFTNSETDVALKLKEMKSL